MVRSSNADRSNVRCLLDIPVEVSNGQLDKPKAKNEVWLRNNYVSCLHIQCLLTSTVPRALLAFAHLYLIMTP